MKKILSLVLAALMIFSVVPAAFAADTKAGTASEYQDAVDFLKLLGLYKGTAEDVDAADELVQRYQMALFVARFITGKTDASYWATTENDSGFVDVEDFDGAGEETLGAISFASQKGIVNGKEPGVFAPADNVQYREAITMIVRAMGFQYKASGYPWSYINKARELGILDGITGVGYTDEIERGVVAQLLYNALNVELDGTTVLKSAFNVGETIVMVTASKQVTWDGVSSKVVRPNYVRVSEMDEQGEPTGVSYHLSYKTLGLKNDAAADRAVGGTYAIVYVDNLASVLKAESLNKEYVNFGSKNMEFDYANYYQGTVRLGKETYLYASTGKFTSLNNKQGMDDARGDGKELKVYLSYGKLAASAKADYVKAPNGDIYDINNPVEPYAIYSEAIGAYFKILTDAEGNTTYAKLSDAEVKSLLGQATTPGAGFEVITSVGLGYGYTTMIADISAFAKGFASDLDGDGDADRLIIHNYIFGQVFFEGSGANEEIYFKIAANTDGNPGVLGYSQPKMKLSAVRMTGLQRNQLNSGDFVLFYNETNTGGTEIDVLDNLSTAKKDDNDINYTFYGYIRGYDMEKDTVYIGDDMKAYTFGHLHARNQSGNIGYVPYPLATSRGQYANSYKHVYAQMIINNYLNQYCKFTVCDGAIVYIDKASADTDFVVVDKIVGFEEDGIVVNAWSTIDNGYVENLKIAQFNGWTVGGFDWYIWELQGLLGSIIGQDISKLNIPVETYKMYQVVYVDANGAYNLTTATTKNTDMNLTVNQYGYILGTDGKGGVGETKYVATNDKDFWLILDLGNGDNRAPKVYTYNGKLGATVLADVDLYKVASNDYVMIAGEQTNLDDIGAMLENNVTFMIYNKTATSLSGEYYYTPVNPFTYGHFMTNALTGEIKFVILDESLALDKFNKIYVPLTESAVYKVVDGVLYDTKTYSFADVAEHYYKTGAYTVIDEVLVSKAAGAQANSYDSLRKYIGNEIVVNFYGAAMAAAQPSMAAAFAGNVTVIGLTPGNNHLSGYYTTAKADIDQLINNAGSGKYLTVVYLIGKDMKATAWVIPTATDVVVKNSFVSYNTLTKVATATVDFDEPFELPAVYTAAGEMVVAGETKAITPVLNQKDGKVVSATLTYTYASAPYADASAIAFFANPKVTVTFDVTTKVTEEVDHVYTEEKPTGKPADLDEQPTEWTWVEEEKEVQCWPWEDGAEYDPERGAHFRKVDNSHWEQIPGLKDEVTKEVTTSVTHTAQ